MLGDHERCQVVLVTVPETTPVNELLDTIDLLRARVDVRLGPVVVNQVDDASPLPDPAGVSFGRTRTHVDDARAAAEFRRIHRSGQAEELARLSKHVRLGQLQLPAIPSADLEPGDIERLAAGLPR
jgi:hypothetical protein